MKFHKFVEMFLTLMVVVGCTQQPSRVVYKNSTGTQISQSDDITSADNLPSHRVWERSAGSDVLYVKNRNSGGGGNAGGSGSSNDYVAQNENTPLKTSNRQVAQRKVQERVQTQNIAPSLVSNEEFLTYIYTVERGDTLLSVAQKHGTTIGEIISLNGMKSPYTIAVGQKIKVPAGNVAATETKGKQAVRPNDLHIVVKGDTLYSIARRYGVNVNTLMNINHLEPPYALNVGQEIIITETAKRQRVVAQQEQKPARTTPSTPQRVKSHATTPSSNQAQNQANTNTTGAVGPNIGANPAAAADSILFSWPLRGNVVSTFGKKDNGLYEDGITISAPKGTNFGVAADGTVAYIGNELRNYGTIILVKHNGGWISVYAHCDSVKVKKGDMVRRGQIIGTVGDSGNTATPQLYFSLRKGRTVVDPIKFLEK